MKASRGLWRALIGLGLMIVLIGAALIFAPPLIVRYAVLHYLDSQGVSASIDNVDANIFTGNVSIDDANGHVRATSNSTSNEKTDTRHGFHIGHLALNLRYPPLLNKRISLSQLTIEDTHIGVRRSADNALRVGGITVLPAKTQSSSSSWGFGLSQLRLGRLAIHYSQPETDQHPAADKEIVLNKSQASDVETWRPNDDMPLDADVSIGDSRIRVAGRITPFGKQLSAHLQVRTHSLDLDLLAPLSTGAGLERLSGRVDSNQRIDLTYAPAKNLSVHLDGFLHWRNAGLAQSQGMDIKGQSLNWQGSADATLLRADEQPSTVDADGTLSLQALDIQRPDGSQLTQASGRWQGQAHAQLAAKATQVSTDGHLTLGKSDVLAASKLAITNNSLDWNGQASAAIQSDDDTPSTLDADGKLVLGGLHVQRPDGVDVKQAGGHWQGQAHARLAARATDITTDGHMTLDRSRLLAASKLRIASDTLDWTGQANASLQNADDKASTFDANGTFSLSALSAHQPGTFDFTESKGRWKGKAQARLGANAATIASRGKLTTERTRLSAPDRLTLASDHSTLDGDLGTTLAKSHTEITSKGSFTARQMTFAVPRSIDFDSDALDWQGSTSTRLGSGATTIDSDGRMTVDGLGFDVPDTSEFSSRSANWQGQTHISSARLFSREAKGTLAIGDARLNIVGSPLAIVADRAAYQGRYAEQPDASGKALRLAMDGSLNAHEFKINNTAIGAAWFSAIQLHAADLSIDGLDHIRVPKILTSGVRILGDTDTSSAVLQAITMDAESLALDDLAHYSAGDITLKGADIHTRRTSNGFGVISQFMSGGKDTASDSKTSDSKPSSASSTYAIKHLGMSGPAIAFVDTTVTPEVNLTGSDINLSINGLDTASPEGDAEFRLSLDTGAYGHLDARGKVAPMATKGINMNLDAWLRSLAMTPLSGYLDAALGRKIANGAADGTLHMEATDGQLDGDLNTTLSNFRLDNREHKTTEIAYGISLDSALALVRGPDDLINFQTLILGDVTNPYFSVKNLVREAIFAGLRTTLLSDYSPVGLLNRAKNAFLNLFRSVSDRPAYFEPGFHYIRPDDRQYLGRIAKAMYNKPDWSLTVQGHANPDDHKAMANFTGPQLAGNTQLSLKELARQRGEAVRDYLAARNVNPARVELLEPIVDNSADARPMATFSVGK